MQVKEQYQNHGIGTLLVDRVVHEAKRREYTGMFLGVYASNEGAQGLYERLGFRVVQALGAIMLPGREEPEFIMVKDFPAD